MFNVGFDPLRPGPRFPLPEELPGFRVDPGAPSVTDGALPAAEPIPRVWWEQSPGPNSTLVGGVEPQWPWLRAPTDDPPGFRLNPDGSMQTGEQGSDVRLMSGALAPLEPQEQPNDVAGSDGVMPSDASPSPPAGTAPLPVAATSIALPASAASAASGGGAADLAALAARIAPTVARAGAAAAGAGAAAASALPFLLIPTNTQSETTDLGDGLRARIRPGQRTVEIERRTDNGLFGTGLLAKWETLPVEAWQQVGRDGSVNTVINHEQLNQALGRGAPGESKGVGATEMVPPKNETPKQPPPTDTAPADEAKKPDAGNLPGIGALAPSKIDAKVLEEAKQRDPEEERVLACRAVREMPGQPAPLGQYSGPGGIDAAVGIRVAPGFPAPKGGYGYDPDYLRHWTGYRGELELKNRIQKAVPYEKIVHYGNPAGDQGPDVLTIGPDGRFMEWNSRSRLATRRITRPGIPTVKYANAKAYVESAAESGEVPKDVGDAAMQQLTKGNYNVCTVGTGNAYDGYFEAFRNHTSTGSRK